MPKTDLHCRLDGSVSISVLWKELREAGVDVKALFGATCNNEDDLRYLLRGPVEGHTPATRLRAKRITKAVLQTPAQLERAVNDVLLSLFFSSSFTYLWVMQVITRAVADHVVYMELVVRPNTHIQRGLTPGQALDIFPLLIALVFNSPVRYIDRYSYIILEAKSKLELTLPIRVGIIVYGSAGPDDPIQVLPSLL